MLRYIRSGKPDPGFALFESKSLKWPGFVEFDDVNGKVLTYSAQDRYIFSPQYCKLCSPKLDSKLGLHWQHIQGV